jgi:hypothetical protein
MFNISGCLLIDNKGTIVVKGIREKNGQYKLDIFVEVNEIVCVKSLKAFILLG